MECPNGDQYIVDMANTKYCRTWDLSSNKKHKMCFKTRSLQGKKSRLPVAPRAEIGSWWQPAARTEPSRSGTGTLASIPSSTVARPTPQEQTPPVSPSPTKGQHWLLEEVMTLKIWDIPNFKKPQCGYRAFQLLPHDRLLFQPS
ncbi:hypothetical protein J4Q44_G00068810 [Coregonus suidteri]|uniref:Uncharacterized protein n=1 Tax=Coregonus suidteri TaxID=861788 RepID=A0AAN8M4Q7_9TELE